ncbi:MAG: helicase-related protein, partial [Nannocystaceae bacterium]
PAEKMQEALEGIKDELLVRLQELRGKGRLLEAQRLEQRTMFDLEMLEEMGFCSGIENYSRHMTGRNAGEPPPTLLDYFAEDFLMVLDESHQTVPQIGAMFKGDRSRKNNLVEHGFRLPSAVDNRPLKFHEWEQRHGPLVFMSATPGKYEIEKTEGVVIEQIIRPTGLLDPEITIRPIAGQVDDLFDEIQLRLQRGERVLVTTLTKRMAEDLTEHYADLGLRVRYMHSDVDTLERVMILRELRTGAFDVLVGINLLREGLDLPEVSLVAILDADKEGFLREYKSLIQTCGRAARNLHGQVLMYADRITASMRRCIDETQRRREIQTAYNAEHGIVPTSTTAGLTPLQDDRNDQVRTTKKPKPDALPLGLGPLDDTDLLPTELPKRLAELKAEMAKLAGELRYEQAAKVRDRIRILEARKLEFG